jgi:2-isopropylmalate synthase
MIQAVIEAGAKTINVPDTVGYTVPHEFYDLIKYLFKNVKNINDAIISVHCHNDLGLATANAIAAIQAGARQVECTVNGIGERAGNTAMEEVVMTIKTRGDLMKVHTDINTQQIMPTSKLLTNITGVSVQPNKAVVGDNAFAHESGIHQDGVLKNAMTYEIMRPEDIGITKSKLVLGKHSGRHAVLTRLKDLGYELKQEELDAFFVKFKSIADSKKEIYDEDLIAILGEVLHRGEEKRRYTVENVQISTGMSLTPVAVITIKDNESNSASVLDVAHGNGGVDAGVKAVKKITGSTAYIRAFNLVAITGGSDALCEVSVTVEEEYEGKMLKVFGNGMSIDISVAGIMSFVDALNKLDYMKKTGIKQNHYLQDGI